MMVPLPFLFDVANLKQRVFKNKKCQRFFSKKNHFFRNRAFFCLKISFLPQTHTLDGDKTKQNKAPEAMMAIKMLFDKVLYFCCGNFSSTSDPEALPSGCYSACRRGAVQKGLLKNRATPNFGTNFPANQSTRNPPPRNLQILKPCNLQTIKKWV